MNTESIHPMQAFLGESDVTRHNRQVDEAVAGINKELERLTRQRPCNGVWTTTTYNADDVTIGVLLEVVWKFRRIGWNVEYGFHNDKSMWIMVGISWK